MDEKTKNNTERKGTPKNLELLKRLVGIRKLLRDKMLRGMFVALVLDEEKRRYQLYLVNRSEANYSSISALTGAYYGGDDDLIKTNEVKKEYGALGAKSFILLEEDYQNMLDFTIWYNLDICHINNSKVQAWFSFRYPSESEMEMLPIINRVGKRIELKQS